MSDNLQSVLDNAAAAVADNVASGAEGENKPKGKPKRKLETWPAVFSSEQAALDEAKARTEGPKRAFKITVPAGVEAGDYFVVCHDQHQVGHSLLRERFGVKVEELGVDKTRAIGGGPKILADKTLDRIKEQAASLSEEARADLMKRAQDLLAMLQK